MLFRSVCDVSGYHKFHEKSSLQEKDTGCILATYFCDMQVTRASAETEGIVSGVFVTFLCIHPAGKESAADLSLRG